LAKCPTVGGLACNACQFVGLGNLRGKCSGRRHNKLINEEVPGDTVLDNYPGEPICCTHSSKQFSFPNSPCKDEQNRPLRFNLRLQDGNVASRSQLNRDTTFKMLDVGRGDSASVQEKRTDESNNVAPLSQLNGDTSFKMLDVGRGDSASV
jgi:hypothetical protein